ncbi:MAG: hypothetical protein V4864_16090 [Pseudomonadota bacterium]
MKLEQLRDYLTMPEVAMRWKATDPEMCRAVLKGLLKPSLYLNGQFKRAEVTEAGSIELVDDEAPEQLLGWHYITPIQQVGALDCIARTVAVVQETLPGASMWALDKTLSMRDLMRDAVVMAEDLIQAEAALEAETHWQQRSAKTKEFNSVLNILSIVLADAYHYDPRVRSSIAREITEAGELHEIAVSAGTIAKWMQEANEQFPPAYMNDPVPLPKPAREAA